ncbi:hypothetical protein RHGRI_016788 [Rhododendron griersonianum]|uniref:Putative plant transposon protein domain-containing protein n=1 Tax=Rhododendron griersonianum TaxID=479676 RepID=A0AAV6JVV5_9ERIC|nr:hypothetical protein RHGRI_016788 [Rhododendron griersonianum]
MVSSISADDVAKKDWAWRRDNNVVEEETATVEVVGAAPSEELGFCYLCVMETPNRSTNSKGVSYDWESTSESESWSSREDSHSNTFGGNDVEGEGEGYGILSSGYNLMSFYASQGQDSFEDAREVEYEMTSWMRKRWERKKNKDWNPEIGEASNGHFIFGVGDPVVEIAIMAMKRKIPESGSSPSLRRSKRLAAVSVEQSTEVIEERSVAIGQLKKITRVPEILKDLGLNPICTYRGKANWTLVREFFAGIDPFKMDKDKRFMVSRVRGHNINVTSDRLAQYKHVRRPVETEKQYPYLPGVEIPSYYDIWNTMCHGNWPEDDIPNFLLNGLKKDFVLLHHIFWWNVKPKSPRRELNANQAMLLHAVYNGFKPDIATLWWDTIYEAWCNNHPKASLPLGHLLTGFLHKGRKLPDLMQDKFGKEVTVIGRGTLGKSEGQSKFHRKAKNPATLEGIQNSLQSVLDNQFEMFARLRRVERVVCSPSSSLDED